MSLIYQKLMWAIIIYQLMNKYSCINWYVYLKIFFSLEPSEIIPTTDYLLPTPTPTVEKQGM